ncbi:MAG: hypothetical protein V3V10_09355 [Planctomycetota bacterium]
MAGAPNPYGHQQMQGQMPAFDPRGGKQKGGTAPKVWGIMLLVAGIYVGFTALAALAMGTSVDNRITVHSFLMPAKQKVEFERLVRPVLESTNTAASLYSSASVDLFLAAFSIFVGISLLRSKPRSWRLATIRAGIGGLIGLPLSIWHTIEEVPIIEAINSATMASLKVQTGHAPPQMFSKAMDAGIIGTVILTMVVVAAFNIALFIMMNGKNVKKYLDSGAGQSEIPGYDGTMGMAGPHPVGPGPAQQPQGYGQPENPVPPSAAAPNPDVNQPPPQT